MASPKLTTPPRSGGAWVPGIGSKGRLRPGFAQGAQAGAGGERRPVLGEDGTQQGSVRLQRARDGGDAPEGHIVRMIGAAAPRACGGRGRSYPLPGSAG